MYSVLPCYRISLPQNLLLLPSFSPHEYLGMNACREGGGRQGQREKEAGEGRKEGVS